MSTILRQMLKDLRLLKWPVATWVVLVAAANALELVAGTWSSPSQESLAQLSLVVTALVVLATVVFVLIVGLLLQHDSPVSSNAFWITRPVSAPRVLVSKVLFGMCLLVLVPVLCDAITMSAFGLSPAWLSPAAILVQTLWLFGLMAVAAVTVSLPQYLLVCLFEVVLFAGVVAAADAMGTRVEVVGMGAASISLFLGIAAALGAIHLSYTYLTRHHKSSAALLVVLPFVLVGITVLAFPSTPQAARWLDEEDTYPGHLVAHVDRQGITASPFYRSYYEIRIPHRLEGLPAGMWADSWLSAGESWFEFDNKRVPLERAAGAVPPITPDHETDVRRFMAPILGRDVRLLNPFVTLPLYGAWALKVPASEFLALANEKGTMNVAARVRVVHWRKTASLHVGPGSGFGYEGVAGRIANVRTGGRRVAVTVREAISVPFAEGWPSGVSYILRNRRLNEAMATDRRATSYTNIGMARWPRLLPVPASSTLQWTQLHFDLGLSDAAQVMGTSAWLEGADLLAIERRHLGYRAVTTKIADLRLGDLSNGRLAPPVAPR